MKPYYSKEVIKRFTEPKNFGEIKNADTVGKAGNPRCGDVMRLYIKVGKKKGKEIIQDIRFHTLGCAAAIATSDVICDIVRGKTLNKALKVGYKDVVDSLGYLPAIKVHCSFLAEQGLKDAIKKYEKKKLKKDTKSGLRAKKNAKKSK